MRTGRNVIGMRVGSIRLCRSLKKIVWSNNDKHSIFNIQYSMSDMSPFLTARPIEVSPRYIPYYTEVPQLKLCPPILR